MLYKVYQYTTVYQYTIVYQVMIKKKEKAWADCPEQTHSECNSSIMAVRDALDILSGKWKLPIIITLTYGSTRFKEIERKVDGITAKMLSKELKDLEINKLVSRTVYDTTPVTVEYALTDYGSSLKDIISALHQWGVNHRKKIMKRQ